MAEVLTVFDTPVSDELGTYEARAVGRPAEKGMWEGWIEFVPASGTGDVLVTGVETTQPERSHLEYWAGGLTAVYLEGALRRARTPTTVRVRVTPTAASSAPAERRVAAVPGAQAPAAVLNPFDIGERSLDVLSQELKALNGPRLLNIIAAYRLNPGGEDLSGMSDVQLARFIVVAVEAQLGLRAR
jgi:hypothetical protein